jgi:hypothetical protein
MIDGTEERLWGASASPLVDLENGMKDLLLRKLTR